MNYKAIVLAAGQGKRMNAGYNKQLIKLNGTPLIIHSLQLFETDNECSEIILVVSANEREDMKKLVENYNVKKVRNLVIGGVERQDSVYAGLSAIDDKGIVLIHDGARPFVKQAVIQSIVEEAEKTGSAIAAVPVKDTIKRMAGNFIEKTVERTGLWAAQTPQGFQYDLILEAHQDAKEYGYNGTDDASLIERLGKPVSIVESDYLNLKLTTEEDLLFAETILKAKENKR